MTTEPTRTISTSLQIPEDTPLGSPEDTWMNPSHWEQMVRVAQGMSRGSLVPDHLRGDSIDQTTANCLLVVEQSYRWGFSPFAVMPETYVIGGKLGYQGKLIAAVVNSRAGLAGRLKYGYNGEKGDELECTVTGTFRDTKETCTWKCKLGDWKTFERNGKVKAMWVKMPMQKLGYTTVTQWARQHCPEIMLGVATEDDLDRITAADVEYAPDKLTVAATEALEVFATTEPDPRQESLEVPPPPTKPPIMKKERERLMALAEDVGVSLDALYGMTLSITGVSFEDITSAQAAKVQSVLFDMKEVEEDDAAPV